MQHRAYCEWKSVKESRPGFVWEHHKPIESYGPFVVRSVAQERHAEESSPSQEENLARRDTQQLDTCADTMQHEFNLYKLCGYITGKIAKLDDTEPQNVKDTYRKNLGSNDARIIQLRAQLGSLKMSLNDSVVEHLQKLKEVRNQLKGVGEIVADKEMVVATIIILPREGPLNLGPFITNLCTQGRVRSIPFNEFEGLLLQEES
eukprot:Gb_38767 [translate_table: standard]